MRSKPIALGLLTLLVTAAFLATAPLPAKADGPYHTEIVTGNNPCQHTSLALDSAGRPRMSYYDSVNHALKYTSWNGASWDTASVASIENGGDTSLALDASGNPRICYLDWSNLWYASWNPGTGWTIEPLDGPDVGQYPSLALDASGNPRASYYDQGNGSLKYASWNGASWDKVTVDTGDVGLFTSLALDAFGHPRISYYDQLNGNLNYASWNGSPYWDTATVDSEGDVGLGTSLALDASGNPRICYVDSTYASLKYASWNPGTFWSSTTVDAASTTASAMSPSLALSPSGNPCVGYIGENHRLKYSSFSGSSWSTATVDFSALGDYPSMRLNNSGRPMFGYVDTGSGPGLLKFACVPPDITALTPDNGIRGQAVAITDLEGSGFCGTPTVELRKAGSTSIGATGVTVNPAGTKITCTFDIPGDAAAGPWNLSVQNPDGFGGIMANPFTVFAPPNVSTGGADSVTATSALLNGSIDGNGGKDADQRGFTYRKRGDSTWTEITESHGPYPPGVYALPISNLDPGTYYDFVARAHNPAGWGEGTVQSFRTQRTTPVVTTGAADTITTTGARFNGDVTSTGGADVTSRGFIYRKVGVSTWSVWTESPGPFAPGAFSHAISGLDPNTTYEFASVAGNAQGSANGSTLNFKTDTALPGVTTSGSDNVTINSARLSGNMTANGGEDADQRGFQYRRQGESEWTDAYESSGPYAPGAFTRDLSGLDPNTTYQFKARAHNSAGWADGDVLTFTTGVGLPTAATDEADNISTSGARLNGEVTYIGGEECDQQGFAYRKLGESAWTNWSRSSGPYGTGGYSHTVTGLDPNTVYEFVARAHNSAGWGGGLPRTFTTNVAVPAVTTDAAFDFTASGARLNAEMTSNGGQDADQRGFLYRRQGDSAWTQWSESAGPFGVGEYYHVVTGLDPNTIYQFKAQVYNSAGSAQGSMLTFTTEVALPVVTTDGADNVTTTGARLNAEMTANGGEDADQRSFAYRRQGDSTWTQWSESAGPYGVGEYYHVVTGLDPNTTYQFKAQVHNSAGWSYGAPLTFRTDSEPVPPTGSTWYLAEGSTAWGFETYISVVNPNSAAVTVDLTYMPAGEPNRTQTITMVPNSRATVYPKEFLGEKDFSTKATCREGLIIAADRDMEWTGPGSSTPEDHSSIGVTTPAQTWYLPEGSANWGFETWLLIQNPNATTAHCQVTYMIEGGGSQTVDHQVDPNSRASVNMATDIGQKDAAIKVQSDVPVVPERSMYRNNRREGSDSIGTTTPTTDFYLAEGSSAWGFTTYVVVQNPNSTPSQVNVSFMTSSGPKSYSGNPVATPANSRITIRVNDTLPNTDFSTHVTADKPIVAERSMYWNSGTGEACHDSIGLSAPHTIFFLPDGQAGSDVETWTLVQNPNATAVTVKLTYMDSNGGVKTVTDSIPANTRKSYNMADAGVSGMNAIQVSSQTAGKKIMVERSMYFYNRGAGTDTIGAFED